MLQGEELSAISADELAALARVNRTTATRWKNGTSRVPYAVVQLVRLMILGEADALLGAHWRGWRFGRDGLLYGPAWRRGFSSGEILALPFLYGRIKAFEREARERLRARRLDRHHARTLHRRTR
jgi:hypothetical protein